MPAYPVIGTALLAIAGGILFAVGLTFCLFPQRIRAYELRIEAKGWLWPNRNGDRQYRRSPAYLSDVRTTGIQVAAMGIAVLVIAALRLGS